MPEYYDNFYESFFLGLCAFRYVRLIVQVITFWCYRPAKTPDHPMYQSHDVTVVIPTVDPDNEDFMECLTSCLENKPKHIFIIGVGVQMRNRINTIVVPLRHEYHDTKITVLSTKKPNKRLQIASAIPHIQTAITVLSDDHVVWISSNFLRTVLNAFEDPVVGGVGTNKRVRRTRKGTIIGNIWNMLGALYLERHNFEIRATNVIDGGVFVLSGRTSAHRTEILKNEDFLIGFTDERFFFGLFGPLNSDDDNYITRYEVNHGWKLKIQYCQDALVETTLGTYPKFIFQCLRWSRTTWRSNTTSLFVDRKVWISQPWCVYAVYLNSYVNFALFYDSLLVYTFSKTTWKAQYEIGYLLVWIFTTKLVKLVPYFLREPCDLIYLPAYFAFAYFHSFVKLYALFTFWDVSWDGRDLYEIEGVANS